MKSFRTLLVLLVVAALAVAVFLTSTAIRGLQSLGDQATRVYVAKDVTADILPPPLYLIEMRLVASEMLEGALDLPTGRAELERLHREYMTRVEYWRTNPPFGLESDLLGAQHTAAERVIALLDGEFVERLTAGDRDGARRVLTEAHALYLSHRSGIDATVQSSAAFAGKAIESFEQGRLGTRRASLLALGGGAVGLSALFLLIRRRLGGILGAEPEALAVHANRLAGGNLDEPVPTRRAGSVADALEQMRARLAGMMGAAQRSASEALAAADEVRQRAARDAAVAQENARIRTALDRSSACMLLADTDGRIVYINDSAQRIFTRHAAQLARALPEFAAERLHGARISMFEAAAAQQGLSLHGTRDAAPVELRFGTATLCVVASGVIDAQGQRLGSVLEWRDRTEEAQAEQELQSVVDGAVEGDLTVRVSTADKSGFVATLSGGLNRLLGSTEELVRGIQVASGEVNQRAREVASGSADVGSRAEQQAASLEETASSMEQMTATVRQNADNSTQASELAVTARREVELGRTVVASTVEAVRSISESSQRIGEIVGVIDGIAFQTNLLALNAAVEAARAGEVGRGFAVVASEVRALATRSSDAASEIKQLIAQSSERVRHGERLAGESGAALDKIVAVVGRMTEVAAEIAAASREQSAGVTQIDKSVTDMDRVTQETAALMEQAGAAAASLMEQADALKSSVHRYRTRIAA
jgi:PAS domain S-box-containing protein